MVLIKDGLKKIILDCLIPPQTANYFNIYQGALRLYETPTDLLPKPLSKASGPTGEIISYGSYSSTAVLGQVQLYLNLNVVSGKDMHQSSIRYGHEENAIITTHEVFANITDKTTMDSTDPEWITPTKYLHIINIKRK